MIGWAWLHRGSWRGGCRGRVPLCLVASAGAQGPWSWASFALHCGRL